MYAEFKIGKICQFCTLAHIAHVGATIGFFRLANMYGTSDWASISSFKSVDVVAKERRKAVDMSLLHKAMRRNDF